MKRNLSSVVLNLQSITITLTWYSLKKEDSLKFVINIERGRLSSRPEESANIIILDWTAYFSAERRWSFVSSTIAMPNGLHLPQCCCLALNLCVPSILFNPLKFINCNKGKKAGHKLVHVKGQKFISAYVLEICRWNM